MIERDFVAQRMKEYLIQEHISNTLLNVGHSHTKMQKTPLGEKIVIYASRPGLVVGRKGQNIKSLTIDLKKKFNLENPQIEISEVEDIHLDAKIVAEMIASSLERFGSNKFKGVGHKTMGESMNAGALGIEILISGKIPSSRARRWRFYQGYLKKSGDISLVGVRRAYSIAQLKSGIVGIQVSIMPPDLELPDSLKLREDVEEVIEERPSKEEEKEETKEEKKTGERIEKEAEKKEEKTKTEEKKKKEETKEEKEREEPKEEKKAEKKE